MQRLLLALVVLLAALLLGRDPRVINADSFFSSWLLRNTDPGGGNVPLTVVEIERNTLLETPAPPSRLPNAPISAGSNSVTPLELALFLQSVLDFKPTVVAIEPVLRWRERDKDQEQIFLDQAMRVPKLLLAAELTSTPDPDLPPTEIVGFQHVSGRRGDLPTFTGIARQPDEDLRLISTLAYVNLPDEAADETHVPLLFNYRGDVIPSFALQAYLTWARIPMSEVEVAIGSYIGLPGGRKIPISWNGSVLINPNAVRLGQRLGLSELLVLAQQKPRNPSLDRLRDDLVLARAPEMIKADDSERARETRAANVVAAAIATMQSNHFVRRVSLLFDCVVFLIIALLSWPAMHASRIDLILGAIAVSAAYCLAAFAIMSRQGLWVPGIVPLSAIWLLTGIALVSPRPKHRAEAVEIAAPPPAP